MKSNYKKIGEYIRLVDVRNSALNVDTLLGLTIAKLFIPSVANIIGTDMANYKKFDMFMSSYRYQTRRSYGIEK